MRSRALHNILRIERCFQIFRRQQLQDMDATPVQQLLISRICQCPGKSQDEYAEWLCLDKTTVAHHMLRLEKGGYIDKQVSPEDGRARCVFPTPAAQALYPRIHATYETFTAFILTGLSQEDQQELTRLSEILYHNALKLIREQGEEKE